jgi:hypothetical protein
MGGVRSETISAPATKSKARRSFCIEMQRNPAHYSVGVRKHWARHNLRHLSLSPDGSA